MVWSDPTVQQLAAEFVPCTEEVDILFPRNQWAVKNLKEDPAKVLFTDVYGPQVPKQHWNERGTFTKQGVYCMMPDGTYLSARFAGTRVDEIRRMLEEATKKWQELVAERRLSPKPIPTTEAFSGWEKEQASKGLLLELHYRDLPRGRSKDARGKVVGESWNRSWLPLGEDEMKNLVPSGSDWEAVAPSFVDRLARHGLKDIVYGQSPRWSEEAVKLAKVEMRRISHQSGRTIIEYRGEFVLEDSSHRVAPKLYGCAAWNGSSFTALEWAAIGPRRGGTRYNFREKDMEEALMGISIVMAGD